MVILNFSHQIFLISNSYVVLKLVFFLSTPLPFPDISSGSHHFSHGPPPKKKKDSTTAHFASSVHSVILFSICLPKVILTET